MKHPRYASLLFASSVLALASCGGGGGGGDDTDTGGTGGGWSITTIDTDTESESLWGVGVGASLALDANGKAHISYYDNANDTVKYATNVSGAWSKTVIDSTIGDITDHEGMRTRIAVDGAGYAKMAYTSLDDGDPDFIRDTIEYATSQNGWASEKIDLVYNWHEDPSIALDTSGNPIIAYEDAYDLFLSDKSSGAWSETVVEGEGTNAGHDNALAVGPDGTLHIVYAAGASFIPYQLRHATGDGAIESIVDYGTDCGACAVSGNTSMAVDDNGKLHVSFTSHDGTENAVRYATNKSGAWVVTKVSAVDAEDTSIGVDSAGNVHISYHDDQNTDALIYATNKSGSWVTTVVDESTIEAGVYSSLQVDANDKIHIAYMAQQNGINYLKYAVSP